MGTVYETIIGLEIHAELSTKTKAFCACEYRYGGEVNTQCCPVCMGLPGTLPILNRMVVEYALRMGIATNCHINQVSKHDRKNYFYPDLPKGYQVTQADIPICENGVVEFYHQNHHKKIRLARIHIEEDTAKLLHDDAFRGTLIDFNRSGVPLIEIVSEPDLRSSGEAKDYLEAVRTLLDTLDICNCRMQEGTIRCDVNVSVRPKGQEAYGTRVEMKNVNSFSGAMQAIEYEAERQTKLLQEGKTVAQETRRWDEKSSVSVAMRTKEDAADYRYFPDADLLPLVVSDEWIEKVKNALPELPVAKYERYLSMGLSPSDSAFFVEQPKKAVFFDDCVKNENVLPKTIANWIIGEITARLNKNSLLIEDSPVTVMGICEMLRMIDDGIINNDAGKVILNEIFANGGKPSEIAERLALIQNSDEDELSALVDTVLSENEKSVTDYRNGKTNALGFLVGQCMKMSKGKANPQIINQLLRDKLGNA
ncbi:MAG: Asp-tRNA(Asn)/Glu-tRNA(Gln) amidotransferase subunit GatB [Lachnospiraceae bacterium]|jgi:aspartyl-tRNA(Asn)/glutamyl-tRNA(Gln) amidotransferase subunit B|nr:Asp-tRNA(Asn)/Glu-tRNA(Gln) amidotransferase subunit GatB [Lachnospiraceae bacterium]